MGKFPSSYGTGLVMNAVLYPTIFFVVWRLLAKRLAGRKIQKDRDIKREQLVREIINALFTMCVGAATSSVIIVLGESGMTKVYLDINDHSIWWAIATFPVLLVLNDTVFYWVHRLLHTKRLYNLIHHEHHKSVTVNPFTSLSFNVVEVILLTTWLVPISLIMPIYAPALGLLQIYGLWDNIKGHMGYELFPSWFNRSPLRFLTTATYHDLHHTKFRGNYGLHFRWWDWMMGTANPDYEAAFERASGKANQNTKPAASQGEA
jgi:Delta7-sterol 5-desaturase